MGSDFTEGWPVAAPTYTRARNHVTNCLPTERARALLRVFMQKISRPIVHFPIHIHQRRANKQYIRVARLRSHTHLSPSLFGCNEQLWLHVQLTELSYTPSKLKIGLHSLQDPHVSESNLTNEFKLRVLCERRNRFCHLEHTADDVVGRVAQSPDQMLARRESLCIQIAGRVTHHNSFRASNASSTFRS